jgi:lipoate-protein ligase A
MGVVTSLSQAAKKERVGCCFVGAEKFDLLWNGRKIAGAAQRRSRHGLLIQGSVQPPPISLIRSNWPGAMRQAASEKASVKWAELGLGAELASLADELRRSKYSQSTFNERR